MKPIQVMFDESLLKKLDSDAEVRRFGRSSILRRATAEYLRRSSAKRIAEAYRRAYDRNSELGDEFTGWETEGSWPEK